VTASSTNSSPELPGSQDKMGNPMHGINPLIALGVTCSTATTDAVYVLFTSAVSARRRLPAASWSSLWYLLSAFAVISYTSNSAYVAFAALGSWLGAFGAVTWLRRKDRITGDAPQLPLKPL
jgi:hypothetical protein